MPIWTFIERIRNGRSLSFMVPAGRLALVLRIALLLPCSLLAQQRPVAQPDRITGRLDPRHLVAIKGNIHPKARPENDRGRVSPNLNLDYITLHLKPTPAQQADLNQLLTQMQDPASPNFHKWLTPEQYADRFGSSIHDIAQIVQWLEGQGLTVIRTARGRNFVVFKGAAHTVEAALHVEIHDFLVDGEMHYANATEPSIPTAIEPFTIGFSGLDDFKQKAQQQTTKSSPELITKQGANALAPGDLWVIYDTVPLYTAGISGTGMKLAVMGQSDVNLSDMATFQSLLGLPANPPVKLLVPGGADPGFVSGDSDESDLDLEMTGAIVPNAELLFVYSTHVENSVTYAIDNAVAPVISYSYSLCEQNASSSYRASIEPLAQQANAQGITWIASSGDSGAAACDLGAQVASNGISVMVPASVPEVTAVGGTTFSEGFGGYWASTNGPAGDSAQSYIPEVGWNDTSVVGHLSASGGGMSQFFPRPVWQTGPGVPLVNSRLVPDVAMSASPQHDPYFIVEGGTQALVGGTSAAAPVFAGIVLLMNQSLGVNGLGNINPTLYGLASVSNNVCSANAVTSGCAFHDVTSGDNLVPCTVRTNGCVGGSMGYAAGAGYDMVTGLGSVDATKLILAVIKTLGPIISSVTTAFAGPAIAQNTFIVIKGANLVPATTPANGVIWSTAPSFAAGLMPTQLDGVSVTVNNKPAFVYFYCSAATDPACPLDQLNILTPLDNTIGPVPVVVTSGGVSSSAFTVNMQAVEPSFLLFPKGYIAATHSNYSLVGPTSLYPGSSTPAKPGEVIELYAVGLGLPSAPLVNGSAAQSGSLPVLPMCSLGGNSATLAFAGLISPGLYQLNLTIPAAAANGDNLVSCTDDGLTTPAGDLITVQR
ncbi:MAG: protease pro-enzyme activation domain-containing protein [Bryobacteraceae bacterium]|jgi:uncharacterized protein (TIGR03437 family)